MVPLKAKMIEINIIAALLHAVSDKHGLVFNTRALRNTTNVVIRRTRLEGLGFLTKTLPRLDKAFAKTLAGGAPLNAEELGWKALPDSKLPRFLGEFFSRVLQRDGTLLLDPCSNSVRVIREVLGLFYKYELPYSDEQEQQVVQQFEKTEDELSTNSHSIHSLAASVESAYKGRRFSNIAITQTQVAREAKILLSRLFAFFDPKDIFPRHGPGAVATKQKLWEKFQWSNISEKITSHYPIDEYFYSSLGHVCDRYETIQRLGQADLPAKVILVPKDSRGPRLISCEPVDYQWVQQGLGRAIVELVESHALTKKHVNFTDQSPNRYAALDGSYTGGYATLDLKEASDRVSVDLVRLLFPSHVYTYLEACRSSSTVLPSGKVLRLQKFAPMGSCLCFPIMALTIWAILTAAAPDEYTRKSILVYGDDVIVPTAFAGDAIEHLESFGLKINRDKSCTGGLFRESCGMDAFQGDDVTPVRIRTVWSSTPRPDVYTSWISYANSFWDRRYYRVYDYIVELLSGVYPPIPGQSMGLPVPSLREAPTCAKPHKRRWNKNLQKFEYRVLDVKSPSITKDIDGWSMLLRYFTEGGRGQSDPVLDGIHRQTELWPIKEELPFTVSRYTSRKTSMLVPRWR